MPRSQTPFGNALGAAPLRRCVDAVQFFFRFLKSRKVFKTIPSRRPPSSACPTRAPKSRTALIASLEKTLALISSFALVLPSRGSTTKRSGPFLVCQNFQVKRTILISSCLSVCCPRNRLRKVNSVGVITMRKLKSHAIANPDAAVAMTKALKSMPRTEFTQTISHGKIESPPIKIQAGRSALYFFMEFGNEGQ